MAYEFATFCADCRAALVGSSGPAARERARQSPERLLANEAFLAEHLGPQAPSGRRLIDRDEDADFCVLIDNTRAPPGLTAP